MVGGGCFAYIGTFIPSCLSISSLSYSILLPRLLFPFQGPICKWAGYILMGLTFGGGQVEDNTITLSHLVEFQIPTIFDCDCDCNRSTNYQPPKIMKIIIYTFYGAGHLVTATFEQPK
jgi:hypothetical protein